jgi:hypothetical protein
MSVSSSRLSNEVEDGLGIISAVGSSAYKVKGKSLVVMQVNCRNIYNKTLEFWNLVHTYNPDVVIGTESWLKEYFGNADVFREDFITFRRDRYIPGGGSSSVSKIPLPVLCCGLMRTLK